MLTGKAPFEGESAVAIALKHVNEVPPAPRSFVPGIPPDLEAVVLKALAKDPAERYPSAESLLRDLEAVEARLGHGVVDTESTAVFGPVAASAPVATSPPAAPAPVTLPPPVEAPREEGPPAPAPPGPPPEPPAERPGRRRWLIPVALVALAALGLGAFLLLRSPEQVTVPVVVGQTLDSARAELERAGLQIDIRRRADRAPRDIVFDQAPPAGEKVDDGSSVAVFVSNGPGTVKVPDVVGLTEADAKRRVRAVSLRPEVTEESSVKVPAGIVIRSDPSAGRPVDRRSTVTLVLSSGPEQVEVPDVVGQDEEDAVATLRGKGLSAVVREKASTEPEGTVVSQSPAGGQQIDQGSSVTIFVSNGKVKEVPDVTGLGQAEAESQIEEAGFTPSIRTKPTDQPDEDGSVLSQSPRGGAERREGSTVTLTVGQLTIPAPETPAP
jgi:serine/threonine-protein kinase